MAKKGELVRIIYILVVLFGVYCIGCGTYNSYIDLPPSHEIKLEIPKDAEVFSGTQVHPGTFKIEISLDEIFQRAEKEDVPEKPLVAYTVRKDDVRVDYWLARKDGTFYYATKYLQMPWDSAKFNIDPNTAFDLQTKTLILDPLIDNFKITFPILAGMVISLVGFLSYLGETRNKKGANDDKSDDDEDWEGIARSCSKV